MDLRATCLTNIDMIGKTILEIGPLNRPIVRGERVFYADHCSTEQLRKKYLPDPSVSVDDIVDVRFDLSKTTIKAASQEIGGFDLVVASHVVEHVPNLIGWLEEIHASLKDGGILALTVPDKNYTFDIFRRETEYWMVKEAADEKRTRPSLRQVLEHFTNVVYADAGALWHSAAAKEEFRPIASAEAVFEQYQLFQAGNYVDVHCWIVTPESFETLIHQIMAENSRIRFDVETIPTPHNQLEFYVQLRKPPATPKQTGIQRLTRKVLKGLKVR